MTPLELLENLERIDLELYYQTVHDMGRIARSSMTLGELLMKEDDCPLVKSAKEAAFNGSQTAVDALCMRHMLLLWEDQRTEARIARDD